MVLGGFRSFHVLVTTGKQYNDLSSVPLNQTSLLAPENSLFRCSNTGGGAKKSEQEKH